MDKKAEDVRKFIEQQNVNLYKMLCDSGLLDSVIDLIVAYADKEVDAALEFSRNVTIQLLGMQK